MAIDVPIFRGGQRFRALTVTMATESFPRLLNSREIPANWLAGIIDEQGRYIARVPDHERVVGELASEGWRLTAGRSGLFEFQFREGDLIVNANERSKLADWTVGIAIAGPPLVVNCKVAQGIGMALHELATNAAKYGALSNDAGQIDIGWTIAKGDLSLSWKERGGPPVATPIHQGFGTTVIDQMVRMSVGGTVTLEFPSSGLTWQLECPLENVK